MTYFKILLSCSCLILCNPVFPEQTKVTCPTTTSIANNKENRFNHWQPLYINNEELVSTQDLEKFKAHITDFVAAKWDQSYLENGHCFYKGDDPILEKIIFAQDAYQPDTPLPWIWVIPKKQAVCYSSNVEYCRFFT